MFYKIAVTMTHTCKVEAHNLERAKIYAEEEARYEGHFVFDVLHREETKEDLQEKITILSDELKTLCSAARNVLCRLPADPRPANNMDLTVALATLERLSNE